MEKKLLEQRLKKIFEYAKDVDALLIMQGDENSVDKTFFYITDPDGGIFESSALIVKPDNVKILTSQLEEEIAKRTGMDVIVTKGMIDLKKQIVENLKGLNTIGLNYTSLTLEQYRDLLRIVPDKEFVNISSSIEESRRLKDTEELNRIREAAKIASEAIQNVIPRIKEGMTETELASEMVYQMMRLGASEPSFSTIVAFGKNASMPHYSPGNAKLKRGDFVLIDYGARYKRYCSDVTRTMVFGKATEEQKDVYNTVLAAQKAGFSKIKENVNGKDVDLAARTVIDESKYKGRFIHSLGHGVGMDVHDHPAFSPNFDIPIKENMVVTVEPGIYIPDFGGVRIEDDVIVKKDGCEIISTAPRDLIEL